MNFTRAGPHTYNEFIVDVGSWAVTVKAVQYTEILQVTDDFKMMGLFNFFSENLN